MEDWDFPSRQKQLWKDRTKKKMKTKKNPPMRKIKRSTGWIKATAVKIVKRGGKTEVLIRKRGK
jgi:hypothetical protein